MFFCLKKNDRRDKVGQTEEQKSKKIYELMFFCLKKSNRRGK